MFTIQMAGCCIGIENRYPRIEALCRDYVTQEKPEFTVQVTQEEILRERNGGGSGSAPYLETLAVYRKICRRLLERDILLFHCSALELDGNAYLFTAPSGTGKSTHARLWRERFPVTVINDDKPLLSFQDGQILVHGTPYAGKEGLQTNTSAPVKGIVILHQAKENTIAAVTAREAYPVLLNQTHRPEDGMGWIRTLELVQKLAQLPVYRLGCTISQEAVTLAYDSLTGKRG